MIASLVFLGGCAASFAAGVHVGMWFWLEEPPLREPPRPAEACVEEWTAQDVAAFPARRAQACEDLAFLDGDDA